MSSIEPSVPTKITRFCTFSCKQTQKKPLLLLISTARPPVLFYVTNRKPTQAGMPYRHDFFNFKLLFLKKIINKAEKFITINLSAYLGRLYFEILGKLFLETKNFFSQEVKNALHKSADFRQNGTTFFLWVILIVQSLLKGGGFTNQNISLR